MDPLIAPWIVIGALAVLALVAVVWIVAASVSMRRLAASVDERWAALASTLERVRLPDDLVARLEGKSSLGRLGLLIHSTAGFIDPGWDGHVTLELANVATLPIKLYPGMKIGQFCFFRLSSPSEHPYGSEKYGSRYQGQRGPTPSRSFQGFHRTPI